MTSTATSAPMRLDPRALAAATPADRDRVIDAVRVAALAVVLLGHWLMAVAWWDDGELTSANLLQLEPWTRRLTWVLQVMPLFSAVAGVANAASWAAARRREQRWAPWMAGRMGRVIGPLAVFAAVWTATPLVLSGFSVDARAVGVGARRDPQCRRGTGGAGRAHDPSRLPGGHGGSGPRGQQHQPPEPGPGRGGSAPAGPAGPGPTPPPGRPGATATVARWWAAVP